MSHFVMIAALPPGSDVDSELASRLAPYDENMQVDEYPDFEDKTRPEDHWYYTHLRDRARAVAENDHSAIKPYNPNTIGWSSAETRETPEAQWAEFLKDAERFNSLPTPVTWPALIEVHNAEYYPEDNDETHSSRLQYDAESDRAFTWSTYNPESKWDWYQIGGRWSYYFPYRTRIAVNDEMSLIQGSGWPRNEVPSKLFHCEGGRKGLLDLECLRRDKEDEAAREYDKYKRFAEQFPAARPWAEFVEEFIDMPSGAEKWAVRDRARTVYSSQPLIQALRDHPDYRFNFGCLVEQFKITREEYLAKARREAVPGYALLTLDKEWIAPGTMGMFGSSDDTDESMIAYKEFANGYIDGLPDDVILVAVDLHI